MTDEAPPGKIWFCMMCGKMSTRLSAEAGGWDESCAMNSVPIDQGMRGPTMEQRKQFAKDHEAAVSNGLAALERLIGQIKRRETPSMSPELRDLAQQAVDASDRRAVLSADRSQE